VKGAPALRAVAARRARTGALPRRRARLSFDGIAAMRGFEDARAPQAAKA
jgi:hypothetical protein